MPVIGWYRSRSLVARFLLSGLILTALSAGLIGLVVSQQIERAAIDHEVDRVSESVAQLLGPSISPTDFEQPIARDRIQDIAQADQHLAGHSQIREVRIWAENGRLVYGRDPEMIGARYIPESMLTQSFTGVTVSQPVLVPGLVNEALEPGMQTFTPIQAQDGAVLGAYEIHHITRNVVERIHYTQRILWISVLGGLALVYVGLFGIVKRASTELEWQHQELAHLQSRQEIDRMKTEFASTVSHELRAPLTSLIGYTELLLTRGPDSGPAREWAEMINRQSARLSELLDDILSASLIEDNAMQVTTQAIDLPSSVSRAISGLPIASPNVSIETHLPPNLPAVTADGEKLLQILTNLVTNAVKYSPDGGEVRVTAALVNGHVRLSVIDRGLGISETEIPRLFERFHRAHARSHPEIHGTGLGLYISRGLAELLGGRLWAESEGPGLGSAFHLELPLALTPDQRPASVIQPTLAIGASR